MKKPTHRITLTDGRAYDATSYAKHGARTHFVAAGEAHDVESDDVKRVTRLDGAGKTAPTRARKGASA